MTLSHVVCRPISLGLYIRPTSTVNRPIECLALDVAGAYNGAGSMLHWVTPPPLTSHLKHFLVRNPKFELPALKILTTWNVHIVHIVEFYFAILQLYIGLWRISIFPLQQDVNRKAALHVYFRPQVAKSRNGVSIIWRAGRPSGWDLPRILVRDSIRQSNRQSRDVLCKRAHKGDICAIITPMS